MTGFPYSIAALRPAASDRRRPIRFRPARARGQGPTPYPARRPQASLATLLRRPGWALHFNDHIDEAGDIVFRHACQRGSPPSASAHPTSRAVRGTGSRVRTRLPPPSNARLRKIGAKRNGDNLGRARHRRESKQLAVTSRYKKKYDCSSRLFVRGCLLCRSCM